MFYFWTADKSIFFTLFILSFSYTSSADTVEIQTKQGILRGLKQRSRNGTEYHAFFGIPYAKPPVGCLRFEPPQPPHSWAGVRDATKLPPICIQKEVLFRQAETVTGQEDCLYLNVFTPAHTTKKSSLPVMVWIHGGGFIEGTGAVFGPNYFLDHDIIIVTFNYRLGVIGFLSAADEVLPGNYGMKDQSAALKWVQQNIKDFGGNPQQVTIFGESAGGSSVHLHQFSPLSKGLFHRAISQSGSARATWAQVTPAVARQRFMAFSILAGCSTQNTRAIVLCLRKIAAEELALIVEKFYVWDTEPVMIFGSVIEPETVPDAFLTTNTWIDQALNEVPWILGMNSGEGTIKALRFLSDNGRLADEFNVNHKRLMPVVFSYLELLKPHEMDDTTEKLMDYYFNNQDIGMETSSGLVHLISDALFTYDIITSAQRHTNTLYMYFFDHQNEQSITQLYGNLSIHTGVTHGDDLFSFFYMPPPVENTSPADLAVSKRLVKYWVNFAYTGKPTLDNYWKPSKCKALNYLHIRTENDTMESGLLQDRFNFWKNVPAHPINVFEDETVCHNEL